MKKCVLTVLVFLFSINMYGSAEANLEKLKDAQTLLNHTNQYIMIANKNSRAAINIYNAISNMEFQLIDEQPITNQQINDVISKVNAQIKNIKDQIEEKDPDKAPGSDTKTALEKQREYLKDINQKLNAFLEDPSNKSSLESIKEVAKELKTIADKEVKRLKTKLNECRSKLAEKNSE